MKLNSQVLTTAFTSLLAAGTLFTSASALAAAHANEEQCAGVIKSGKNDCATSKNACHGHVKANSDPEAWIYVPKGTCDRIVGARVVKVKEPTRAKANSYQSIF